MKRPSELTWEWSIQNLSGMRHLSAPVAHSNHTLQYTDPPTALGFWIALEKCTSENGALSFLPGSHLTSPITKRFVRLPGGGTGFEAQDIQEKVLPPTGKYILEPCEPGMYWLCFLSC